MERGFFQYYLLTTKNNRQGGEYNTETMRNPTRFFLPSIFFDFITHFLSVSIDINTSDTIAVIYLFHQKKEKSFIARLFC